MIFLLSAAWDRLADFTGQLWFAAQESENNDPIPATINEVAYYSKHEEDDDSTPLPPPTGSDKPECKACGDPNFSLEGDLCIACRIGMP